MQYPQDDYPGPDNLEDGPVIAVHQVTIGSAEKFVFRNRRAALRKVFECADLLFQTQDKGSCRLRFVLGDILPYFGYIRLSGCGNVNAEFFLHALTLEQ